MSKLSKVENIDTKNMIGKISKKRIIGNTSRMNIKCKISSRAGNMA
jgi:hypothetical protein